MTTIIHEKCSPGNECRLTVENATKIQNVEEDVRYIKTKIDNLVIGVSGAVILLLIQLAWQLSKLSR